MCQKLHENLKNWTEGRSASSAVVDPGLFIFIEFWGNIWPINSLAPTHLGFDVSVFEILDPPLYCIAICFLWVITIFDYTLIFHRH